MAVSSKGKRKLLYNNAVFYYFVRVNNDGIPRLHIMSDDKKINLEKPLFDTEVPVLKSYVISIIKAYMTST